MANTIKIKRGLSSNIDNTTLAQGELAITTDTNELYVGVEGGKKKISYDVVLIYDTDDKETIAHKLAEAADGPYFNKKDNKIKKDCFYIKEEEKIYRLIEIWSSLVEPFGYWATFSNGFESFTLTDTGVESKRSIYNIHDGKRTGSLGIGSGTTYGEYSVALGNSYAISDYSTAEGDSSTGLRGYRIISGDSSTKTYTLETSSEFDLQFIHQGDSCVLTEGYFYENQFISRNENQSVGTVTDKTETTITVSNYIELDTNRDDHFILIGDGSHYGIVPLGTAEYSHAEGKETFSNTEAQHVQGKYNIIDTTSAHIVGNGSSLKKSNAHTIDWSGNAWFAGDVYTGSTSGTNKDEGSKILATKEYVDSKTSANYTYDKVVYVMPASEITTTTGTTAFTQDSEARTFTAVGAINGEDPVTYENVITLTADVKNILIYSVGSLIGDMGPADQIAQISITDISGTTSQILNTRGCSENLINTGPLTSGSKLTLTYTSGTYEPSNAQQVFTLEYYTETVTDASLQDFISSKVTHESTDRRQMDMILQKNIDAQYSDLQTQIFDLQGHVIENMLDAVIYRLSSIDDNSEFRFFGPSNSGVTDLGLSFEDISLTSGDKFEMSATFQTASSGCTFEITESTSVKVKLTGDDVTNGVLNPVANKVYEIAFYWNGFFMSGVVRGVDHEAAKVQNKITITNTTSTDATYSSELVVGPNEDLYNNKLATLTPGQSQEFTIDGNLIYVGSASSPRYPTSIDGNPSGCTVNWEKRGDFYYVYEIEITSSPASCSIRYT